MMNIIDAVVILFLALGAVIGFKKGFIKTMVTLIGTIIVIIISYKLKDPIAGFMFKYLPFFDFTGIYQGITVLNILIYKAIAFLLVFVFLYAILGIIINVSGIVEKILNATIILGALSKVLGAIAGLLEMIAFICVVLFALVQFNLTSELVLQSKVGRKILDKTPLISKTLSPSIAAIEEIYGLHEKYENEKDKSKFNEEAIAVLKKYDIVTKKQIEELIKSGKLKFKSTIVFY